MPSTPEPRQVVDLLVDPASGATFLGINGTVVTEADALRNYGDRGRTAYGTDPSATAMLTLVRRGPAIPAIANTSRTAYTILAR